MNNKEVELVLECMAVDMTGALCDTKEPMRDVLKQRIEAINIAQKALRQNDAAFGEPLTTEQLQKMRGNPVLVVWKDNRILPCWHIVGDRSWNLMEYDTFKDCGDWIAYAYPPAHIDREAWKACEKCESLQYIMGANYCEKCGRPLTDEAWDALEKRIMGD